MNLPFLYEGNPVKKQLMAFAGYNHNLVIGDGEFYDMQNMTSDYYPVLSPRRKRGLIQTLSRPNGIFAKGKLAYVDGTRFYYDGIYRGEVTDSRKQFVSMGAYILIFPDKKYYDTTTSGFGSLENRFSTAQGTTVTIKGWKDGVNVAPTEATLVQIKCAGIGRDFKQYDAVKLDGFESAGLNKTVIIQDVMNDFLVVPGMIVSDTTQTAPIKVERLVPDMDFVTEDSNRIWGCSSAKREIYACKLGDPFNWNSFEGLASDAYALVIGSDGDFTGCVAHLGNILFFKEDVIHKMYGAKPSNYQLVNINGRGVAKGCEASIVIVNEVLIYKSRQCVCAYEGGMPYNISSAFGDINYTDVAAGAVDNKYYMSGQDDSGYHMLVYDTERRLWHKEDATHALQFAYCQGNLYYINSANQIMTVYGDNEGPVQWMFETGNMMDESLDNKFISKIQVHMELESDSEAVIYLKFDDESYERFYSVKTAARRTFTVPIIPRRCGRFCLKMTGTGMCKIFGISKCVEIGTEL